MVPVLSVAVRVNDTFRVLLLAGREKAVITGLVTSGRVIVVVAVKLFETFPAASFAQA